MKPKIDKTGFGFIVIDGEKFEKDVVIESDGKVRKRKKKLSKERFGTSHTLSLEEAQDVYQQGVEWLIIGTGQHDMVRLSPEAEQFFRENECRVELMPTPAAAKAWNQAKGVGIGLFHVTC